MTVGRQISIACSLLVAAGAWAGHGPADIRSHAAQTQTVPSQITVSPEEASRFLSFATLGSSWEEIHQVAEMGFEAWLDEQFDRPVGLIRPYLELRTALGLEVDSDHRRWSWWQQVMEGPDPFRQRITLALSEIFVVSDRAGTLNGNPVGMASYYDMLAGHAFGNYRDLLFDISTHPIMGAYLSHLRNEKSDPSRGRFPDENYAREIMQLFSIGLFELHADGTFVVDGEGQPIPTYDNEEITQFAKIFTGLSFDSPENDFRQGRAVWTEPMRMYEPFHEPGPKYLLRGQFIPPGQSGMQDIHDAVDNLFEHPNVGPFIGRRLIQRLVTSNPSPGYLERVSAAFADNGQGVRGDMRAVLEAILLDPEALDWPENSGIHQGRLRESYLRRVQLARAFDASSLAGEYPISDGGAINAFAQRTLSSPTVFNFFLPDHQPGGDIANAALVAPEFQIITTVTAMTSANSLRRQVDGVMNSDPVDALEVRLDLDDEVAVAADVRALIERLDLILMYGTMSPPMRQILIEALEQIGDPRERTRIAVHLISISPEYCVVK